MLLGLITAGLFELTRPTWLEWNRKPTLARLTSGKLFPSPRMASKVFWATGFLQKNLITPSMNAFPAAWKVLISLIWLPTSAIASSKKLSLFQVGQCTLFHSAWVLLVDLFRSWGLNWPILPTLWPACESWHAWAAKPCPSCSLKTSWNVSILLVVLCLPNVSHLRCHA